MTAGRKLAIVVVLSAALAAVLGGAGPAPASDPPVLVGAGDISSCTQNNDEATAQLLDQIPGTVFTSGDNVYNTGTPKEFDECYDPTWGRHKARTRPAAGNHDYATAGGAGYHEYFGDAAGPVGKGYYAYNVGTWKIIVLNTNCVDSRLSVPVRPDPDYTGNPCDAASPQAQFLRAELASSPDCTAAVMHHPLSTSGRKHPGFPHVKPFWDLLYAYGAEIVLSGDDHIYERFDKQTPEKDPNPANGIRQFTVGTGGMTAYEFTVKAPNSRVFGGKPEIPEGLHGVLKLTLNPGSYSWEFVQIAGQSVPFSDTGIETCFPGRPPDAVIQTTPAPPTVVEGSTVTFDARGSGDDRTSSSDLRFDWDFESDGVWDATGAVATHGYAAAGVYQARLRVTDGDGGTDTASVRVTVNPRFCVLTTFSDDLEPLPEAGWRFDPAVNEGGAASATWQHTTDAGAHSPTHSWFTDGSTQLPKDDRLIAPPVNVGPTTVLTFWHRYLFENGFDGGVLEVSSDGGETWSDVTAKGEFLEGGYDRKMNPAGGFGTDRSAWTGGRGDAAVAPMTRVVVDLGGYSGQRLLVRWRSAHDALTASPALGWWVDDVEFTGVLVSCNQPPIARDDAATVKKNKSVTVNVLANDSDPDGDALTITSATQPANGSVSINADGTVTYRPKRMFVGTDSFRYTISDGKNGTATATVTIVVLHDSGI